MQEQPVIAVERRLVRDRMRGGSHSFTLRAYLIYNTVLVDGMVVCPAEEAETTVSEISDLLRGLAHVVSWHWIEADSPDGDCIVVRISADADPGIR